MNYRRVWAEINLAHIARNLRAVKGIIPPDTHFMGIVKADGYGHGLVEAAKTMLAGGANSLGVAICEEGIALREAGITAPILIMGFTPAPLLSEAVWRELTQTVFSLEGARALSATARQLNKRAKVHIKIDTGMSRLGFLPKEESIHAICEIARDPQLEVEGIYTHCATSDALDNTFVYEQQTRFAWVVTELEKRNLRVSLKHMANSGAVAQGLLPVYPQGLTLDAVRVGILLYGLPPSHEMEEVCKPLNLQPAMRLYAQVSMVKQLAEGVGISYGHLFKTKRPTTIAVIPVGYADGYPRRLTHGGRVLIRGKFAPIVGAICMDQCMVDVTDIEGVKAGDTVTMLGSTSEGIGADDLADIVGTISYEIICGIGKRVPRVYINGN
ncbi:MAG: alanine racemase [Defluviitaleaceae bacterium]|nr:alanine racemase [Defluviitaleaceae bacterium]MCL2274810.1 alanine racemase [Defluviitaleaceae bacterium]